MKRILATVLLGVFLFAAMSLPAQAVSVSKNVYGGAFALDEFPGAGRVSDRSNDTGEHPYDIMLVGRPDPKSRNEDIDRVYMDFPDPVSEYIEDDLIYPFTDPDGEEEKFMGHSALSVKSELVEELWGWDSTVSQQQGGYVLTELDGQPALVKETGSRVFGENTEQGYNAQYSYSAIILVDNENVRGFVGWKYSVSLTYKITGAGWGRGWDDHWDEFEQKQQEWWSSTLLPSFDKAMDEVSNVSIHLTRERVYQGELGQTVEETQPKQPIAVTIDTDAEKTAGETEFSVPAAVVLGIAAAGAAAAGAGAAGAGASGDDSGGGEDGSFEMIVGKDFGDALKLGKKQRVWARMAEVKNGVPVDRPDLTGGISIFSNEVLVGAASLRGANLEAEVQIQENAPPTGIISFLYSGAYGSFQNDIRFRLLGKGEIKLSSDKASILSTDSKPFELVYELKNFAEEEPPLEITASSGFVALDLGKNDKQQTVVLIAPGPDAEPWDHKSFTKSCRCEMTAMDGKLPVKAVFEVTVCFEGIGTAYDKLPIDELPADALVECFTEAEKEKREEKALWIPLAVMKWDEKRRALEPDTDKADALQLACEVHPDFEFKSPDSKKLAERVVTKSKLEARPMPAPPALKMDKMKKPSAYRLLAAADPGEGAAPFDLRISVSCEGDTALEALLLKAQIKPNPDFKGMVRWFLEYPIGSAAAEFITLGNVDTYHGALDFIESRVYPMSGVPWSANLLWNKSDSSHYETGRGDIMRKSYIAIQDPSFPGGIGDNEFKKVQTLVHELTHVIEDQHGDYDVSAKSERHAYYLQHLSDVSRGLTDLENPNDNLKTDIWYAINWAYWFNVEPLIIGDLSDIGPWFGGKFKVSVHELFDKYAYHTDTLGGRMSDARRQDVAQGFRHWYFPGNLSECALQNGTGTDATGRFTETDGPFQGAEWTFVWDQGVLKSIALAHGDYTFKIGDYYWTGGNELKLKLTATVEDKKDPAFQYDSLSVTLDGGTYNMSARSFTSVRSFAVQWESLNDSQHSLLHKKIGFPEASSWTKRKK